MRLHYPLEFSRQEKSFKFMYSLYYSIIARKLGLAKTTDWGVALRKTDGGYETILSGKKGVNFSVVENTDEYWFADPLLFSDGGNTWLFVEAFNRRAGKGEIGVFDIVDGKAENFKVIIDTPTHMSYPFVFKHCGEYFMIPETGAAHHIALYKAKNFPYEWEMDTVLMDKVVYRDHTVTQEEDGTFALLSYKQEGTNRFNMKNTFTVFKLDMDRRTLTEESEFLDKKQSNRPAGPCFKVNGKEYRVSQKCNRAYGEAMFVYEIDSDRQYCNDKKVCLFDGNCIKLDKGGKVVLTHTYSQAGGYEVVDYRCLV